MPFPAHPGDTVGIVMSPLELPPMLGPPPLLPTFTAGRAFKPGGGTSCFPCLHGHEMWHTGQAPVLPGPMEMSWQLGVPGFLRHLWTGLRGGTQCCWWKGKEHQNSQFAMQSACQWWLLLPSNPFKSRRGDRWDMGTGMVSLGRQPGKADCRIRVSGGGEGGLQGLGRKPACC